MRLVALAVLVLAACPKSEEKPRAKPEPERPTPEARVTTPVPIHELLAYAKSKAPGQTPWRVSFDYVRPDGLIDPAFGVVEVWFGADRARAPEDDPDRPTGAPVTTPPKAPPATCNRLIWRQGVWSNQNVSCDARVAALRCTVPIIWERAIAKGAPRDAVAKVGLVGTQRGEDARWMFVIEDKVRNVDFRESFPDDCGLVAEAPDPTVGPDTAADGIDRKMIQNSIGTVKATIRACASQAPAKGIVKLTVRVSPEGTPAVIVKEQPSEALGACVKKAVEGARFPPTRNGGSFSYPFVF